MNKPQPALPLTGALEFASAIEQAREIMLTAPWYLFSATPQQEQALAERQLKNQIAAALDKGFVLHDPLYPEFSVLDQHNQFGLVNPDNRYHLATIDADGTYEIRGKRGTSAYMVIQIGAGNPGVDVDLTSPIPVKELSGDDLILDDNGEFTITISEEKGDAKNWLPNHKDGLKANSILIRESFMDWQNEKSGTWYIERLDTRGQPSPIPTLDSVNDQYALASEYLINSTFGWVKFVDGLRANLAARKMSVPRETVNGLPGQWNAAGWFPMNPNIAYIITVEKSNAQYQSIQLGDFWFNAQDFPQRHNSITAEQAKVSRDGKLRFVISQQDPGVANWLDPAGVPNVFAFMRWQGASAGDDFSQAPKVHIVPTADVQKIREYFPDELFFSPEERAQQLAERRQACLTSPRGF